MIGAVGSVEEGAGGSCGGCWGISGSPCCSRDWRTRGIKQIPNIMMTARNHNVLYHGKQ